MRVTTICRRVVYASIGLLAAVSLPCARAYVGPSGAVGLAPDLSPAVRQYLTAVAESLVKDPAITADREIDSIAEQCLTAAELLARGDKSMTPALQQAAAAVAARTLDPQTPAWGRRAIDNPGTPCTDGGLVSFGTCDPVGTSYAFQSGLAMACLARASKLMGSATYGTLSSRAFDYWTRLSSTPPLCRGCRYFQYSDAAAAKARFVRNTNLFMALPFAVAQGRRGFTPRPVAEVLLAEGWERSERNHGYYSALDPQWRGAAHADEIENIDSHTGLMASVTKGIYEMTGNPYAATLALAQYQTWAGCTSSLCQREGCAHWGGDATQCLATVTYVHCAFRQASDAARASCNQLLRRTSSMSLLELLLVISGDPESKE